MPGCARKEIVREGEIGVYHAWSRCVQRAFLCGEDPLTGTNYDYRRQWIQRLLEYQAGIFAVDVGNYSILHNHEHLIIRTRPDIAAAWSDEDVAWRWKRAWPSWHGDCWSREPTDQEIDELLADPRAIAARRRHLCSLSWFMARWKEPIARLANAETNRRGHFWEQRFGCRELADEGAVLTCSIYIDVNQVKAGVASALEESNYSAIQDRIRAWRQREAQASVASFHVMGGEEYRLEEADLERLLADCWLAPIAQTGPLLPCSEPQQSGPPVQMVSPNTNIHPATNSNNSGDNDEAGGEPRPFTAEVRTERQREARRPAASEPSAGKPAVTRDPTCPRRNRPTHLRRKRSIHQRLSRLQQPRASNQAILSLPWDQYLTIAQWAAEQTTAQQYHPPPLELAHPLRQRRIDPDCWYAAVDQFESWFHTVVGSADRLAATLARTGRRWRHGINRCRDVFT